MLFFVRVLCTLLFILTAVQAHSDILLLSRKGVEQTRVSNYISEHFPDEKIILSDNYFEGDFKLIVALEDSILDSLPPNLTTPVIGGYVSLGYSNSSLKNALLVYRSPSPAKLSAPIHSLFHNYKIGYVYSQDSKHIFDAIAKQGTVVGVEHSGNIYRDIRSLLKENIDLFLLFDDRSVIDDRSISKVIETLYRKDIPVVTNSYSLKKAGPIVSLYVNHDDYIQTIIDVMKYQLKKISADQFKPGQYFTQKIIVDYNHRMLDIFDIKLPMISPKEYYED